ncbi:MAG: flagellar basal body P-ring protein FlgI, partial [Plesiomonas sp.]
MRIPWLGIMMAISCVLMPTAKAARIKDVAAVEGVRNNQLVGYGLVVGLTGTGEKSPFTEQSFKAMLQNFGIQIPPNVKPKINNVAAVAVTAELAAFTKQGQTIDVTVSSLGEAKSLRGGMLLQTMLKGLDGQVYAVAQGNLVVGGFSAEGNDGSKIQSNTPTVGRIPNGATVEQEVPTPFARGDFITYNLHNADFTSAKRMAESINDLLGGSIAQAVDATSVRVRAPRDATERVNFVSTVENINFDPAEEAARIVVNSRTGTIVVGQNVRLRPAAITHGGLTVTINENLNVSQPNPLSQGQTVVTPDSNVQVDQAKSKMVKFDPGV